ncbi:TetR/AcrR family transcriptional regulator [Mesorhizobium sp. M1329]|uniref:TetR/AcrR family transcriptional regulator n=1 Tax=Mesorhizobium sp. M1329 TaxID=2957083 RepID=UPI00333BE66D
MARRKFDRQNMIAAARRIAFERGAGNVTLEAVAREIGATKGAVLHSFPSKAKLFEALLKDLCEDWDERFRRSRDLVSGEPSATLRAYLETFSATDPQAPSYAEAMLLALAEDPRLMRPVREAYQNYARMIEAEANDVDHARVVWMACEGIMMLELMGLHRFEPADRSRLFGLLTELAAKGDI